MKSIMQYQKECYFCGSTASLEKHHIFNGAYRTKSENLGLTVYLCHNCHNEPPYGVHHNADEMKRLKAEGQAAAMNYYGWSEERFRDMFGKSYLP